MAHHEESETSGFLWLLTGVAIGAVFGVLYAPRRGEELRGEIGDYARQGGEKARGLVGRIGDKIPARVKMAAGFGAVKSGGSEALREVREDIKDKLS